MVCWLEVCRTTLLRLGALKGRSPRRQLNRSDPPLPHLVSQWSHFPLGRRRRTLRKSHCGLQSCSCNLLASSWAFAWGRKERLLPGPTQTGQPSFLTRTHLPLLPLSPRDPSPHILLSWPAPVFSTNALSELPKSSKPVLPFRSCCPHVPSVSATHNLQPLSSSTLCF